MARNDKVYALRCASAERVDFFEAGVVTTSDGVVEIRGGAVREPYLPHEVYRVPAKIAREVRAEIAEIERAVAEAKAFPSARLVEGAMQDRAVRVARARDDIDMTLPHTVLDLVRKHDLHLFDEKFLTRADRSEAAQEAGH
jgi:hypothetical protein